MTISAPDVGFWPALDTDSKAPDTTVPFLTTAGVDTRAAPPSDETAVSAILTLLKERTSTDFTGYRAATVYRRILNRMISLGVGSLQAYLAMLREREDEASLLLQRLTIKVSRFYRNGATFDLLRQEVIPRLARRRGSAPLRIWSAGCGYGEEAYTLAMLLDEAGQPGAVLATDIDPMALDGARNGTYAPEAAAELPPALSERYLERLAGHGPRLCVQDRIRRRVHFVRHDLTQPAGPPDGRRFDLVCCRNVLIYFERTVHEQALLRLRQRVADGGYLCLGEAEWPSVRVAAALEPLDKKARVFRALGI